ncbi:MAG TPA: sigma-70 family RNA polymerase sigma factor [Tepidisphaeraceae bacterium]|nr:sigma-70 family RNA polymerase sigma factor [Tepidisphaeraceae bacterium]
MNDQTLLNSYVAEHSDTAFRQIVERYLDLVYTAARRQVRDPHLADDVTQMVFLTLARKAHRLSDFVTLHGWLLKTTHFCAMDALRKKSRRQRYEQKAAEMKPAIQTPINEVEPETAQHLDSALAQLSEADQTVIAMRYFEGRSARDIAESLGITEMAAAKRTTRAIERLREQFAGRNLSLTAIALESLLAAQTLVHAPAPLLDSIARGAVLAVAGRRTALFKGAMSVIILGGALTIYLAIAKKSANAPPAAPPIKVGILISQYTATGPCWTNNPHFGYLRANQALSVFRDSETELYAILEPETNRASAVSNLLRRVGRDHIIDGTDVAALEKLDVIVSYFQWNVQPDVLHAINLAVKHGTGLFFQASIGSYNPGYTADVQELQCIRHAKRFYFYLRQPIVHVMAQHPILQGINDSPQRTFTTTSLSGSIGEIQGTPLISSDEQSMLGDAEGEAERTGTWDPSTTQPDQDVFYPLYVSHLGKGRVVACQFEDAGDEFNKLAGNRFAIHCLQWLAGRAVH